MSSVFASESRLFEKRPLRKKGSMNFGGSRLTPLCKYCGREVRHAQIEAKLTAEVCREGVEEVVRVKEKAKFLQPRALFDELQRMMIEGDLKISLKALRDEKSIFWNLLYQFNVFSLPYALMLPYFEDGAIEARDPYSRRNSRRRLQ
mmetsp:Transcript_43271/g.31598  ORF Transcript_43271/g.31598 Transcript_43271/m.31598 type:complete len:147 (+) Transcript_43271:129-569(+)